MPNPAQAESIGPERGTAQASFAGFEGLGDPRGGEGATPDLVQGSRDDSDHVVEEPVAADVDLQSIGGDCLNPAIENRSNGRLPAMTRLGEGSEVVPADQLFRCCVHDGWVELVVRSPDRPSIEEWS